MAQRSLTIYIDGRCLLRPRDGVGTYVRALLQNVLVEDTHNTYIALGFADQKNVEPLLPAAGNFSYHFLPMPRKAYMGLFRIWQSPIDRYLPKEADVVWYPDFVAAPWIRAGKKILTIHDLTYLYDAATVESKNLRYLRRFVPHSIKKASALTTVSKAMAAEIKTSYNPAAPVSVIYPAAPAETPGTPNTTNPYILFVGTLQPRKNVRTLLKAYASLPQDLQKKYQLVLAGRKGWNDTATQEAMAAIPHQWIDGPNDEELHALYDHASLFVMPSLREGFGIPTIEALANHVPVITSTDPALVEATGDAALHVPADDIQGLAEAIARVLTNSSTRDELAHHRSKALAKTDGATNAKVFLNLIESLSN